MAALIDYGSFYDLFKQGGLDVTQSDYDSFSLYAETLCEWNKRMNLTAITDPLGIAQKHFYDSIYPFSLLIVSRETPLSLADIGSGAGFPGLALKLWYQNMDVTLVDSLNKKVGFLQAAAEKLDVEVKCVCGRAEELARTEEYRESFDVVTARAVANLRVLCELCLPLVKVDGKFVALKGKDAEVSEAKGAVRTLGGEISQVLKYRLPDGDERSAVVVEKIRETQDRFPRSFGRIKAKPL